MIYFSLGGSNNIYEIKNILSASFILNKLFHSLDFIFSYFGIRYNEIIIDKKDENGNLKKKNNEKDKKNENLQSPRIKKMTSYKSISL